MISYEDSASLWFLRFLTRFVENWIIKSPKWNDIQLSILWSCAKSQWSTLNSVAPIFQYRNVDRFFNATKCKAHDKPSTWLPSEDLWSRSATEFIILNNYVPYDDSPNNLGIQIVEIDNKKRYYLNYQSWVTNNLYIDGYVSQYNLPVDILYGTSLGYKSNLNFEYFVLKSWLQKKVRLFAGDKS